MSTNGKGDTPRPTNLKRFRENYDGIDWKKPSTSQPERKTFPADKKRETSASACDCCKSL